MRRRRSAATHTPVAQTPLCRTRTRARCHHSCRACTCCRVPSLPGPLLAETPCTETHCAEAPLCQDPSLPRPLLPRPLLPRPLPRGPLCRGPWQALYHAKHVPCVTGGPCQAHIRCRDPSTLPLSFREGCFQDGKWGPPPARPNTCHTSNTRQQTAPSLIPACLPACRGLAPPLYLPFQASWSCSRPRPCAVPRPTGSSSSPCSPQTSPRAVRRPRADRVLTACWRHADRGLAAC